MLGNSQEGRTLRSPLRLIFPYTWARVRGDLQLQDIMSGRAFKSIQLSSASLVEPALTTEFYFGICDWNAYY